MALDPAIWRERAQLTLTYAIQDALDVGEKIDDVPQAVRCATRCPFGRDRSTAAYRFWETMLARAFSGGRRRRKGGG